QLKSKYTITAFLDNGREKQGTVVAGIPVRNPETFDYESVEQVFIASMYFDQILVQLLALGVTASKIEDMSEDNLMRATPRTGLPRIYSGLLRPFYLPFRLLR